MPYVTRNAHGQIVGLAAEGTELLPPTHPEVLSFLFSGPLGESSAALLTADMTLIRVIEDVVEVLIDKRLLSLDDLPEAARGKLSARGGLRHDHLQSLHLVGDWALPPI